MPNNVQKLVFAPSVAPGKALLGRLVTSTQSVISTALSPVAAEASQGANHDLLDGSPKQALARYAGQAAKLSGALVTGLCRRICAQSERHYEQAIYGEIVAEQVDKALIEQAASHFVAAERRYKTLFDVCEGHEEVARTVLSEAFAFVGHGLSTALDLAEHHGDWRSALLLRARGVERARPPVNELRSEQVDVFAWDQLPKYAVPRGADDEPFCHLTQEPLQKLMYPVVFFRNGAWHAYEAAAFLKWWEEHGTDPLSRQRMSLISVVRPIQ